MQGIRTDNDDREREGDDNDPFHCGVRSDFEDRRQEGHVKNHEVHGEGGGHGEQEVRVDPRRHRKQRPVFGDGVEGVEPTDRTKSLWR